MGWILAATVLATGIAMVSSAPDPPARMLPPERMSARIDLEPSRPDRLRLAVIGDLHGRSDLIAASLRAEHAREALDGVLVLGDNFDDCGVGSSFAPEWKGLEPLLELQLPLFPILGNHDYGNPKRRQGQVRACGDPHPATQLARRISDANWKFPARNYVISTPHADIVMVDTTPVALHATRPLLGSATGEEISAFAEGSLRSPKRRWKLVAGHHNAPHSGVQRWKGGATRRNMNAFAERISSGGADLYLSGHQHHLELLKRPDGMIFVISGAASSPRHPDTLERTHRRSMHATSQHGYAVLDVTPDVLRVSIHAADGRELAQTASRQ